MNLILGIDLGTTNSVVAIVEGGKLKVLEESGTAILPSVVGLDERGELLVGAPARNQYVLFPDRTIKSIKRKMGEDVTVTMGTNQYSPQEVSAIILRTLKERAERHLGFPVRRAVITVPAFFNELQRDATRAAGELAGLEVVRIINEPTAAALTYQPHPTDPETLLVYDLGGGTFDVSIVRIERGVVEVLASHGDTQLGGDDFDQLLLNHLCDGFQREHGIDLRQSPAARSRLLHAAEDAKIRLSDEAVVSVEEEFISEKDGAPLHLQVEIHRGEYESLIGRLVTKTLKHVDAALADARLNATDVSKVLLVGGSTRTPLVQMVLADRLGQPVNSDLHPDLSVAMGAAVQGALIAGVDVGPVLVDITPHTLGIEVYGRVNDSLTTHCFSRVIHRNTPLPANRSELYATCADGQEAAHLGIFQGEQNDTRYNRKIGELRLEGLADADAGNEILVRFALDLDGMLKISATERATGLERQLTIENAVQRGRRDAKSRADQTAAAETSLRDDLESNEASAVVEVQSPEVAAAVQRGRKLISNGQNVLAAANPEDAEELRDLIERLETAIAACDIPSIDDASASLEDLVFYLQDA
ncbi:MAG: Hsp70 family protein [Planctomycetes bacterium]|nr:Hsp70 family protein [Planctomycetota bacterium]